MAMAGADMATANYGSGDTTTFLGNGNGNISERNEFKAGTNLFQCKRWTSTAMKRRISSLSIRPTHWENGPSDLAPLDFNADGYLDKAIANFYSNSISILVNNTIASFNQRMDYAAGNGAFSIAVGDFNGDGRWM
jgi:hypothetical protein